MNGKGDTRRPENQRKWEKNYAGIKWKSRKFCDSKGIKPERKHSRSERYR